jgi:hypothetical protein
MKGTKPHRPPYGGCLRLVLGIFSLDESLGPRQGGGDRSHEQGVLDAISGGIGMLGAWPLSGDKAAHFQVELSSTVTPAGQLAPLSLASLLDPRETSRAL